ncbi:MAG: leucine-rich repeat protein, partial [Duncaniella sp.]|nr:leucine-rich repeat protein [Duncaniella sp.]
PVLYCGQDVSAGHAFVCDGYEMMGNIVYLHINWGWGGGADGFYASDALNPTMSKTYNFSNLTTVVYNIKPATVSVEWSPIHLTSDENQVGMTMDVTDIQPGTTFKVRAGALKNISNNNFSGKISLGLFAADGTFKQLLCDGKNFGLSSLNVLRYTDISCTVPADAVIGDGDVIRLVTKDNASTSWLPVANDLITLGEARAKGNVIPYFNINFPAAVDGAEITYDEPRVIKGRDFSFTIVPTSPDNVVTVKANGFILTPNNNTYNLNNVTADQTITVIVQNAADVVSKRTLWVQAGKLSQLINETEAGTVTDLTLYGTIDATDFTFMRDRMKLSRLDISGVSIQANGANPANAIPSNAFSKCGSLRQIVLPKNINTFKSGCFSYSGLTSIEIPSSVSTYEYNIFLGCSGLREVTVRRAAPAWVNWCVFQGTPKAKLIVPVGASAGYQNKDYWKEFKEIEEQNPVADSQYTVTIQDVAGIKFTPVSESTEVAPGSKYEFKVDTDDSFGDATVELYANNTRLYPGANGLYTATINSNTMIHANFRQPEATWPDSPWKITGAAGGVGLVTDVVNVVAGKSFTIRANALAIPSENADQFYSVALTDKDGRVKELISPVIYNSIYNFGNQPCNFVCQVKDASIREGNFIRIVSSLDKKKWSLVNAANDTITDRISAIGNRVVYYNINMPQKVEGAYIQGGATQVVRGMPFTLKVTPISVDDRITLSVNGINKVVDAAIANLSIPAVVEDLEINIQVNPKGSNAYTVVNVREGELDAKIAQCPARLKVIGVMRSEDFDAFRKHAATIVDLDLADVTIKGAGDLANAIPSKAFASTGFVQTALKTIILPTNLVNIEENAFYRCVSLSEVTIPASVTYVGANAFSSCARLSKIVTLATAPPATGNMSPFPANTANITLEVPNGAESYYSAATFWNELNMSTSKVYYNIQIDPERSFNYNTYYQLTKIDVSKGAQKVTIGLPNSYKNNPTYRPGIAFKLYDNDKDVTTTSPYLYDGQHSVVFDPDPFYKPGSAKYPQDHIIRVVFHYPIEINCPAGIKAEFVDVSEDNIWREVQMDLFVTGSTARPTLYKEGVDYKFRLVSDAANLEPKVKAISKIMTKVGANPEYKTVESVLLPDENGVYVISDLQGDTDIEVSASLVVEEGSQLSSGELGLVSEEEAKNITNIGVSGELDNAAFTEIRDKFKSLETLNLSELTNEEIPANAFLDMSSLKSVVIPENVVTIGSGAFAGCENLESVTLPGVEAIGDGAFDGCSNLTSITMLGKSADNAAEAASRAPRKARLTEDAFRGINPNCLIYIPEDSGIELGTMRNVIVNQGSSRVADTDIVLEQGYPFNAPASFSLGANSISMTIDIPGSISDDNDGWKGVILPFAPDSVAYGEEFVPRGEKVLNLLTLNSEEGDTFTSADSIVANRPYLANLHAPFAKVPVTFIAGGKTSDSEIVYDVAFTPLAEEMSVRGSEFSLYGAYAADNDNADVYTLDENGVAFRRAVADSVAVSPFSVFVRPNVALASDSVAVGLHPVWVFNPAPANDNGFKLYRSGSVELLSETAGSTIYYTVDGSDPASSETRIAYASPFSLDSDTLALNVIAEYKGNFSDAVNMIYELRKTNVNYSLEDGWNWISHNVENEIPVESI